jgi:2-isopropylmalate synthase
MRNKEVTIDLFDTTLRDGAQSLPDINQFPTGSKPELAEQIASLGINVVEAGFPVTPTDAEEVAAVANTVGRNHYRVHNFSTDGSGNQEFRAPIIAALSRAIESDIDITWQAIALARIPRIHTFIATDPKHMEAKFKGLSEDDIVKKVAKVVDHAKQVSANHPSAQVEFSAEAASTSNSQFLQRIVKEAVSHGVDVINVPDTVGQMNPFRMFFFYQKVIKWATSQNTDITISAHNHNDHGLAVANTLALVQAATEYADVNNIGLKLQLETTICGLGERAGNADIFPVVANLFKFAPDFAKTIHWQFNPSYSVDAARFILGKAGLEVPRQSPIVGEDVNVHRNGIHSDAILKGGFEMYTSFDPTHWGHRRKAVHEDGKYQGSKGREAALNF